VSDAPGIPHEQQPTPLRTRIAERGRQYLLLTRLHKPIGALLLLWPTLWALWIAGAGRPDALVTAIFVVGTFLMRSAGCALNDFADRGFDPYVKRTQARPLAIGAIHPAEAVAVFVVLSLASFGLVLMLNRLTVLLAVAGLALTFTYPFMKRHTHLPQLHLGVTFAWGVPMAFAALTDSVPPIAWLILVGVMLWVLAYDTLYAMVDRDDDIHIGVKSTAILFGRADRLMVGVSHVMFLLVLILAGHQAGLGMYYFIGLAAALVLTGYQQYLIRGRERAGCFKAFLNNNWVGAAIFAGIVLDYLLGA
jgi:4-hydroxybenzoate polyprenyltransferase